MTRKVILITLACSVLLAYGIWQGRLSAHSGGLRGTSFRPAIVDVGVEPPAGSRFVRSYESKINGSPARFAHYVSGLPPVRLVERFIEQHPNARRGGLGPNMITGGGCITAGYDDGSHVVGVIAFESPGGSNFFISRAPASAHARRAPAGDVPGVDAPGVPRPLNSVRLLSVQDLGGVPSVLAFYEGWGSVADNIGHYRSEMSREGWKESRSMAERMNQELDGELVAYAKGVKHCIVYFEKDPRSGKLTTAVLYREKNWLPPNKAL